MANKHVLTLTSGPNAIKELQAGDTIDPADASLTGAFVGTTDTQTLTNKTLTTPKIDAIKDDNGIDALIVDTTPSAVNQITVTPSATGDDVVIAATGTDATITLDLQGKGGGGVTVDGSELITADSVTTLTNKTHTLPKISSGTFHRVSHNGAITSLLSGPAIDDPDAGAQHGRDGVHLDLRRVVDDGHGYGGRPPVPPAGPRSGRGRGRPDGHWSPRAGQRAPCRGR
jgi:hypothetical protein